MARPQKEIDWDKIEFYIKAGCSQVKIAKSLFLHPETLSNRVRDRYGVDYSVFSSALQSEGEMLIEAAQFQKALNAGAKGDTKMLIHLGKVRLGQREKSDTDANITLKVVDARSDSSKEVPVSTLPGFSVDSSG